MLCRAVQLAALLLLAIPAFAAVPLSYLDTVIGIQRDGSAIIVEKFAPVRLQPEITWSTSTEYPGSWTIHEPRVVNILQVTTTNGRPLPYKIHHGFSRLSLDIDTASATDVRIVYAIRNAVRFLHDRDELLFTAGEGWRGDTARTSLFVQVPPEIASQFRTQTYIRGRGLLPMKPTDAGPDRVWFELPGSLAAKDQFISDIIFPRGALSEPAVGKRFVWFLGANTIVLLPFATLIFMLVLRALKKLPSPSERSIAPRYQPPQSLTPAEVGVLIDDSLDPRDVAATLIDLAVRGFVKLERCQPDEEVHFTGHDFAIHLLRPKDEWYSLALHERTVLFHTFYGGQWTKLSSLSLRFYTAVSTVRRQVLQLLQTKRMYWADPTHALALRLNMLGVFLAVAIVIQLVGVFSFASSWLLSLLALGSSAAIVYYFGRSITSKTLRGVYAYEQILGFQTFLDSVEADRLQRLEASLFEKWLPYAIALGVEHHWARNFEGVAIAPPEWMSGLEDGIFDTAGLTHVLAEFTRQAATTILTRPRF